MMLCPEPYCSSAVWGWSCAALAPASAAVVLGPDLGTPPGALLCLMDAAPAQAHFTHPINLLQALAVMVGQAGGWVLVSQFTELCPGNS